MKTFAPESHMNVSPKRAALFTALVFAAALLASCSQTKGDLNRVQPNVLKKADLIGSATDPKLWYFRNTVTWTPAKSASSGLLALVVLPRTPALSRLLPFNSTLVRTLMNLVALCQP